MPEPVRIGMVDSGIDAQQPLLASSAFVIEQDQLWQGPAQAAGADSHGSRVAAIIGRLAPQAQLLAAVVMQQQRTSALQVAAAIDWLVAERVQLINLSLGMRHPHPLLQQACARAVDAGVLLVAASPAQGDAVYPAAWPGVIRATGDARCDHQQLVWLASRQADVGACVRPLNDQIGAAGASMGCAHVSGHLGRWLATRAEPAGYQQACQWLQQQAHYQGIERKSPSGYRHSQEQQHA